IHWKSWDYLYAGKSCGGLGFKDLYCFNLALLGKHIWRIRMFLDTLSSKILKAKYFPNTSLSHASCGPKSLYLWKSLHQSIPLVEECLIWRVGDGTRIRIWKAKWLNRPSTHMIQSPMSVLSKNSIVADLIDPHSRWWKVDLLHAIFQQEDIKEIMRLPVSIFPTADKLIWKGTVNGHFSVRS
ncbi:hypothetical protein I3842_01G105500, partial [Carya illinoinensis]